MSRRLIIAWACYYPLTLHELFLTLKITSLIIALAIRLEQSMTDMEVYNVKSPCSSIFFWKHIYFRHSLSTVISVATALTTFQHFINIHKRVLDHLLRFIKCLNAIWVLPSTPYWVNTAPCRCRSFIKSREVSSKINRRKSQDSKRQRLERK